MTREEFKAYWLPYIPAQHWPQFELDIFVLAQHEQAQVVRAQGEGREEG